MAKAKLEAAVRRSVAIILMRNSDYVGAKNKLLEARKTFQETEFIDELVTICDIMCIAELPVSEIDWYSVLQTEKGADESVIEASYTNLIGTLEPMKNKFPGIKSALGLIDKAYTNVLSGRGKCHELDSTSLRPCGSGSKRIASESSDKSDVICNSVEQPSKRVKSLGDESDDECVIIAETQIHDKPKGKVCSLNEVGRSSRSSPGNPPSLVKYMVHEPWLNNGKADNFEFGQIWAAYDKEKMPRKYARIDKIESSYNKETKSTENTLYVRWLRPAPINEDEKKWHQAGLPVSCGYFKLDSVKIVKCNLVVFSHLVTSFQEYPYSNEPVELYPREGDVWALYKDWNPFDWCSDPKTRKGCKFQLVEVLSGSSKESGIKVASLVRVAGYRNVFRRQEINGVDLPAQIAPRNLFIFSHKIPAYRLRGDGKGIFSGILLKLNPFAIPEDVVVDTIAQEPTLEGSFSNGYSIQHPILKSVLTTSGETQCAGYGALSSGCQNIEGFVITSPERLVSPRSCEQKKSQADGISKDQNTSPNNLEMNGLVKDMVGNLTAVNGEEEVAEESDSESEGESLGSFMLKRSRISDRGDSSNDSDDAVNKLDTGHVIRRSRNTELKWQTEENMLSSFERDPVLCMEAVCALHRQQTDDGSITGSFNYNDQRFSCFSTFVAHRGNEIAEFLMNNNPKGDLQKSVEELEMFMPEGLEDCISIATFYSNQVFMIYKNKEDPFFGPS